MYTICWASCNDEGWDRFSTKQEVGKRIKELISKGCCPEDVMIFGPNVDYIVPEENGIIIWY